MAMKILKLVLTVLGIIGLGVGGYFLFQAWLEVRNLWAIANSMRSTTSDNPVPTVMFAALLGAVGGLVLGLGLALPARTKGEIRREALQDASDAREALIRQRVEAKKAPEIEPEIEPEEGS